MDHNELKLNDYQSNLPYPKIEVMEQNRYYATLLMEDYAGMVSELTAVNQYLYHSFIYGDNEYLHSLFKNTSIVEMHHIDILANLIIKLGCNPIYSSPNTFWEASNVYYGNDLCEQLEADLESEYKAINSYKHHIDMIEDNNIKAILKRIILDEEIHVRLFKDAIGKYFHK